MGMLHKVEEFIGETVFYDELKCDDIWICNHADDLAMCLGDCNGHIYGIDMVKVKRIMKEECY